MKEKSGKRIKYIVVTGGVMSGLGKGITAASIGRILKDKGYEVVPIKIDPYINIDAGTMNPFQHGEVFVLKDGTEVDLDLGHYERFVDVELSREHNITTGVVYLSVIEKERRGEYLGQTVQIIPHVTDEIKRRIRSVAERSGADICIVEIGGTVGDIESMPFLEAVRQMKGEEHPDDFLLVHVTLVPTTLSGEQKTKPTQHSVKELRELGLQPDIIVCRCKERLREETKAKIAMFCNVEKEAVISAPDTDDIYKVPLLLDEEGISAYIMLRLRLLPRKHDDSWRVMVERAERATKKVRIAIVGKYTKLEDSYISIKEALKHAAMALDCKVEPIWVEAEDLEPMSDEDVSNFFEKAKVQGILVPGGFGVRGAEGKIKAMKYARERKVPFLGLCFGFQLAVVEFARNVLGLKDANSSELNPETPHPVVTLLPEQRNVKNLGGTMRLGDYKVTIKENTLAEKVYGKKEIYERHRHRYEVNPEYVEALEQAGLVFSGTCDGRMEILELPQDQDEGGEKEWHPFFFATQFHPEFKSRPGRPSPPFKAFLEAALSQAAGDDASPEG
ncbi:MAG: CTP synthase [Candidatus Alkanophagales archaeon MCA70_species_1]|nr:CTP synthase [Candidatus Alkanophaga volatiphilum]